MTTLNQIINRVKMISLAHKQVRNFYKGLVSDFLNDHKTLYPSVFLQDEAGVVSIAGKAVTINFRMYVVDLVHVSEDSNENVYDVLSDTLSIILDLITQFNNGNYNDWKISTSNNLQAVEQEGGDMYAGYYVDFSVSFPFTQNQCEVPTDLTDYISGDTGGSSGSNPADRLVYDEPYTANGTEGSTLTIEKLRGKKILIITREFSPIYPVSNLPAAEEFVWDGTNITLGSITNPNERFLILYRNY